jgi:hypothetical protein
MSCFPTLTWPFCNPDESDDIYGCSSPNLAASEDCCLSDQTRHNDISNCPPGWESNPGEGEWCTDDWNASDPHEFRHKCRRVEQKACYACMNDSQCGGGGKCNWYPLGPSSDCPSCVVTSKNGCCSANSTPKYTCGNVLPPRINPLPSCVAVPNNAAHVTDDQCSGCAKGQSYWPCNTPGLCVWK